MLSHNSATTTHLSRTTWESVPTTAGRTCEICPVSSNTITDVDMVRVTLPDNEAAPGTVKHKYCRSYNITNSLSSATVKSNCHLILRTVCYSTNKHSLYVIWHFLLHTHCNMDFDWWLQQDLKLLLITVYAEH